jgi:hypothetical protein
VSFAPETKFNDEIIDGLCSFIHGAFRLIDQDEKNEFTYAYLLLLASGIERLQKIVYLLNQYDKTGTFPDDKQLRKELGHKIDYIHEHEINHLIEFECFKDEEEILKKSLKLLTDFVTVASDGKRYANFTLSNNEQFDIPTHLVQILDEFPTFIYEQNIDYLTIARKIIKVILQKYIACLVDLIWHKKIGKAIEIHPVCLQSFITEGYIEIELHRAISLITEEENTKARERQ